MPSDLPSGLQEVVVLFDAAGLQIERDLPVSDLEALVAHEQRIPERAASVVRAAYAAVGTGLLVRGVVCFHLRIDEDGLADGTFNLPLRYLVRHAGCGQELGDMAPYRLACRSQCPVPWHSVNLWEPQGQGDQHPAKLIQKAVWRKQLSLYAAPSDELTEAGLGLGPETDEVAPGSVTLPSPGQWRRSPSETPPSDDSISPPEILTPAAEPVPVRPPAAGAGTAPARRASGRVARVPQISAIEAVASASLRAERARHERRLTAMFGEQGRLDLGLITQQHREQLEELAEKYRAELDHQQRNYLEQIRGCRDEIQRLRAALRNEQDRNRRLHGLLRGEI
jgi:hypothetical protein